MTKLTDPLNPQKPRFDKAETARILGLSETETAAAPRAAFCTEAGTGRLIPVVYDPTTRSVFPQLKSNSRIA